MAFNTSSEMQAARSHQRWAKHAERDAPVVHGAKGPKPKLSVADQAAFIEQAHQIYKLIEALAASAGITPTRLPDINRVTRRRGPHNQLPAVVPEVNTPLFIRAKARMAKERSKDLPAGYWGRKQRLYLAAMEEAVEETRDEMYRIVGLAHLMKEVGNMLRGRGEMARRITEEEERAMEAAVEAMSDEELGLTRDEPAVDSEQPDDRED
jgi:hypothetical protein